MTAAERARQICAEFETYAYLPDIEPIIAEAIRQAEDEMRGRCAQVAESEPRCWDQHAPDPANTDCRKNSGTQREETMGELTLRGNPDNPLASHYIDHIVQLRTEGVPWKGVVGWFAERGLHFTQGALQAVYHRRTTRSGHFVRKKGERMTMDVMSKADADAALDRRKAAALDWFARTPEGRRIRAELLSVLRDGRDAMALREVLEVAEKAKVQS